MYASIRSLDLRCRPPQGSQVLEGEGGGARILHLGTRRHNPCLSSRVSRLAVGAAVRVGAAGAESGSRLRNRSGRRPPASPTLGCRWLQVEGAGAEDRQFAVTPGDDRGGDPAARAAIDGDGDGGGWARVGIGTGARVGGKGGEYLGGLGGCGGGVTVGAGGCEGADLGQEPGAARGDRGNARRWCRGRRRPVADRVWRRGAGTTVRGPGQWRSMSSASGGGTSSASDSAARRSATSTAMERSAGRPFSTNRSSSASGVSAASP